ncbi:PREDICTED: rRNA-processing protein FYV7 [Fragaria vesca subsp. vesca]|uniref:rRNA-processing protein FYV7 n=1 Tax=Fragaria vesca subsp. vesca TaxID=101020 RepID=UPI0002C30161|nr:PREDICTED: rRNA-processing protein FYV7 [Fragaria vesca subsp. vesca]
MKNRNPKDAVINGDKSEGSKSVYNKKKNMKRFGRQGRSLEKSTNSYYNPSVIKKKREFYDNAKHVKKYKKLVKQQHTDVPLAIKALEDENETEEGSKMSKNNKKRKDREPRNLIEIYEKKHEEQEKARMEKEAIFQARKEEREKSEARRKDIREKMMKKTRKGQPVMKYRIQHLLETIQGSMNKS